MKYKIKELVKEDLNKSFFETLKNLSNSIKPDKNKAKKILKEIKKNPNHKVFVAVSKKEVLGLTTLLIERKFIGCFGKFGHIEDVVVRKGFERKGVGSALLKTATEKAKKLGCFQVRLCCSNAKKSFMKNKDTKNTETQ